MHDMCLPLPQRLTHHHSQKHWSQSPSAQHDLAPRAPVFTSPTVACLNRPYSTSLSSSVGSGLNVFASSAAASKSSCASKRA